MESAAIPGNGLDDLEPFSGEYDWELAFMQNPDLPPCCDFHAQLARSAGK